MLAAALYAAAAPRLTVVVAVDGLNQQSLNEMRSYWPQGGLRTLAEEAWQTSVTFPHLVQGGNETLATLLTGTTPDRHGLANDYAFLRSDRQIHNALEDNTANGIGCDLHISPAALLTPSLTDHMRMQYGEQSKIYAVGLRPEATVLLAGHAADACCWLDPAQQRWVTTDFYRQGLPAAADAMNMNGRIAELAARTWTPRMDINTYAHPTPQERKRPFAYDNNAVLLNSPAANKLVIELALAMQQQEHLGQDLTPDMLLLQLTVQTPKATADPIQSAEQEDIYLALNQDLGFLIEQLSKRIGSDQYTLLVLGLPRRGVGTDTRLAAGLPFRYFNTDRAAALTSTYLMALYGHERWIDGAYANSIYLNRTLIEKKNLSVETIARQVTAFLLEFQGVQAAYTMREALLLSGTLRNSINKHATGDVFFCLESGWQLRQDEQHIIDHVIDDNPTAPVMLWSGAQQALPADINSATQVTRLLGL